ncbi:uncharacterized protein JCM6883_006687 [Sporobolomyces salmoneus]|uniref:uncharacterized protein n=1 Tax=Sporobolomyces salmoneus TaxID=183962 RepID=UPI00316D02A8
MTTASTSAWVWDPRYSLYYNSTTRQWAAPQPDGSWKYSSAGEDSSVNSEGAGQTGVLEEGEVEGGICDDIPEEQIWPGDEEEEESPEERLKRESLASAPLLRLVVEEANSTVLPREQKIAVLDPAEPVSIGRDRSHERRIRLKELAVSKVHATLFWTIDEEVESRGYWAVVDNGSTHGTFVKGDGEKKETRLSEPKIASTPTRLHHFDTLRCGTTSFKIHIHASFACSSCTVASDSSNIIPLLPASETGPKEIPAAYHTKSKEEKEFERREQLKGLKDKFLKPSAKSTTATAMPQPTTTAKTSDSPYINRAAARRARDAGSKNVSALTTRNSNKSATASPFFSVPGVTSSSTFVAPPSSTTSKPDPFTSESKGAKLLSKMSGGGGGGSSSTPSKQSRGIGLGTLIEARTFDKGTAGGGGGTRDARPGLGSRPLIAIEQVGQQAGDPSKRDWREDVREASRKRFKEMG